MENPIFFNCLLQSKSNTFPRLSPSPAFCHSLKIFMDVVFSSRFPQKSGWLFSQKSKFDDSLFKICFRLDPPRYPLCLLPGKNSSNIFNNFKLMPSYAYSAQYITINWNCVRLWKMLDLILLVMLFQIFKTYHNSYMSSFAKMYMHVHVVLTTFKIEGKQKFLSYGSSICIFKSQITNVSKFVRKRTFMCLAHLTFLEPTSSSVDVRGKTSQLLSRNMKAGLPSPANLLSKYYSQMSPLLFFLPLILEVVS